MSKMYDLFQQTRRRDSRSTVDEARRRLLTTRARKGLAEQWRGAARNDSRIYLHAFNQKEGKEWYVTGWDGQNTVAALQPIERRNLC